jgi:uncharacterized protein (TIGR00369 family)
MTMKPIPNYPSCFVCGDKNDIGLKVQFFQKEGKAVAEFVPSKNFEGYADILHGGIISTLLDEVMIQSILAKGILSITSHIEVKFKNPARTGEKLLLEGNIQRERGSLILTEGKIFRPDGCIVAEGKGKFIRAEGKLKEQLKKRFDRARLD